jgi:hypothetical protein
MLTNQQVRSAVEAAFSPLRCVAEIWDNDQKLRLRIFDSNDKIVLTCPEQILGAVRDVESLRAFLEMVRAQVRSKGHSLGPFKVL